MKAQGTQKAVKRIPDFASYEEEARFWDENSPLDFPNEFEEVEVTFASPLEIVRVRNWHDAVADALAALPEAERQALSLSMLGLNNAQIARVTGYSPTECQKALRAARRKTQSLSAPLGK